MWRLVLTVSLLCCSSEAKVTCRNENNDEVDWYILYKAPQQNTLTGLEYLYIDLTGVRKMVPPKPTASAVGAGPSAPTYKPINHPDGVLANTLRPLFTPIRSMPPNFGFISYSDQPPGCSANQEFGHSKGVVMVMESSTGVWLLHSTPRFPYERDQNNFWPDSGKSHAQTFICVTLPYSQFTHIGKHLQYIGAFPFENDIPEYFHQELRDAVNWVQPPPADHFQQLSSSAGFHFHSIAKTIEGYEDGDLYVTITQRISGNLAVQTWGCQAYRSKSFCEDNKYKVENIKSIKTDLGDWKATVDHSKWCVAKEPNKHWTCIADVNRAPTQYERRGGALCIDNEEIKKTFLHFVKDIEGCTGTHHTMDTTECDPQPGTT